MKLYTRERWVFTTFARLSPTRGMNVDFVNVICLRCDMCKHAICLPNGKREMGALTGEGISLKNFIGINYIFWRNGMYIALAFVLVIVLIGIVTEKTIIPYNAEMKNIKMELKRACSSGEKAYWEHKRRSVKRRYIPLYSVFHRKKKH